MLVHLDPKRVDVSSARAVIEHVRGRLIATTVKTFVTDHFRAVPDPLPAEVGEYLRRLPVPVDRPTEGVRLRMNCDALVWHNTCATAITHIINGEVSDALAVPVYADGEVWIYLFSYRMNRHRWGQTAVVDPFDAGAEPWPCVADVFCAGRGPARTHRAGSRGGEFQRARDAAPPDGVAGGPPRVPRVGGDAADAPRGDPGGRRVGGVGGDGIRLGP
jgi:hypothetical protein